MTKTKKQLRAEAVERLRSIPNEYMNATSVVVAIAGEAAYRLGGTRDARDMCIDLLTDDDSTTESLSDGTDSREKLLEDANAVAIDYWDRKRTWGDANDLKRDVTALLDRQEAITANEVARERYDMERDLIAERDEWKAKAESAAHDNPYVGLVRGKQWERKESSDYYCGKCGWKVTDHDSYCPECGGALHRAPNQPTSQSDAPKTEETAENDASKDEIRDFDDSREKLEADIDREFKGNYKGTNAERSYTRKLIIGWLNRQAAITKAEMEDVFLDRAEIIITRREIEKIDLQQQVDELTAENMNLAHDLGECMADRDRYRALCGQMLDAAHEIRRIADANMPEVAKEVLK